MSYDERTTAKCQAILTRFTAALSIELAERGMTQTDYARLLHLARQRVNQLLNPEHSHNMNLLTAVHFADALDFDIEVRLVRRSATEAA